VRSFTEKEMPASEVEEVVLVYAEWYKRKSDIVAVIPEALSWAGRFCSIEVGGLENGSRHFKAFLFLSNWGHYKI
jgi:hypothetical protein